MPEGDSLFRIAETLRGVLLGEVIVRVRSALVAIEDAELAGHRVTSVEARGKNLLITFDDERTLHTHLRMMGRWMVFPRATRRPPPDVRVALETEQTLAMCVRAPVVRLLTATQLRRDERLRFVGPDLLSASFDEEAVINALANMHDTPIGEALSNQRVVAGIGNVYKSELCFLHRLDPFAPVSAFTESELRAVLKSARELLARNVAPNRGALVFRVGNRRTRSGAEPLWIYGRAGKPCLVCGDRVRVTRGKHDARTTYSCARCQPKR